MEGEVELGVLGDDLPLGHSVEAAGGHVRPLKEENVKYYEAETPASMFGASFWQHLVLGDFSHMCVY